MISTARAAAAPCEGLKGLNAAVSQISDEDAHWLVAPEMMDAENLLRAACCTAEKSALVSSLQRLNEAVATPRDQGLSALNADMLRAEQEVAAASDCGLDTFIARVGEAARIEAHLNLPAGEPTRVHAYGLAVALIASGREGSSLLFPPRRLASLASICVAEGIPAADDLYTKHQWADAAAIYERVISCTNDAPSGTVSPDTRTRLEARLRALGPKISAAEARAAALARRECIADCRPQCRDEQEFFGRDDTFFPEGECVRDCVRGCK
jgi:hypothetical protein